VNSVYLEASKNKPQFGVHLAANYGPNRSNSDRLAEILSHNCAIYSSTYVSDRERPLYFQSRFVLTHCLHPIRNVA
jgi:hypothetical protein